MHRAVALTICLMVSGGTAGASSQPSQIIDLVHHNPIQAAAALNLGWSSPNWSGYAVAGGPYASVTGTWRVPAVSRSPKATYSSSWVGIDGFNNSSLIQTGTEQDYYLGAAHYSAWWEILPARTITVALAVHPGDTMAATITKSSTGGTWTITLDNRTTGRTFTTVQRYAGPGASAEWIQEAPTVGDTIAPLANFSPTTFRGTVNGRNPRLRVSDGGAIVQNGFRVSTPSVPDTNTGGFTVQRSRPIPAAP
jgi:hypothetical protein